MPFDWGDFSDVWYTTEEVPSIKSVPFPIEDKSSVALVGNVSPDELHQLAFQELTSFPEQCGEAKNLEFDYFPELWGDAEPVIPTQEYTLPALVDQPVQTWNVENTDLKVGVKLLGYADEINLPSQPVKKSRTTKLKRFTSQWNCQECGRAFKSNGGLTQHNEKIHSGPTPHRCDICGKRYRDFDSMDQHRQRHLMKDKPCKCSEYPKPPKAPKQFIRESDLRRRMGLHHGVSPHQCDICEKAFDRADHLAKHKWSHANGTVKKLKVLKPQ